MHKPKMRRTLARMRIEPAAIQDLYPPVALANDGLLLQHACRARNGAPRDPEYLSPSFLSQLYRVRLRAARICQQPPTQPLEHGMEAMTHGSLPDFDQVRIGKPQRRVLERGQPLTLRCPKGEG